jgi:hypothetical protein
MLAIEHLQHSNPPLVEDIDSPVQVLWSEVLAGRVKMMTTEEREE